MQLHIFHKTKQTVIRYTLSSPASAPPSSKHVLDNLCEISKTLKQHPHFCPGDLAIELELLAALPVLHVLHRDGVAAYLPRERLAGCLPQRVYRELDDLSTCAQHPAEPPACGRGFEADACRFSWARRASRSAVNRSVSCIITSISSISCNI